jgi:TolA-binding protein
MFTKKISLLIGLATCLSLSNVALAISSSATSESSDSTSSTSGSIKKLFTKNEKERLQLFVEQNFDRLQEDAARGSGVILTDYVSLIGCAKSNSAASSSIKKNYQQLFNNGKSQLISETEQMLNNNSDLAHACGIRS